MDATFIICPKCKTRVSIDQVLSSQLEEKIRNRFRDEFNQKWIEKSKLTKQETKLLQEELERKTRELQKSQEFELKLRQEKILLEEGWKNLELEKQRQIDEERKKIEQAVAEKMLEEHRLKDAEKDKKISDMQKMVEELQLKSHLGSQQLQGEVLELEIEQILKTEFPTDSITPVPKGTVGADILQKVHDSSGRLCGTIIWESKRTKNWAEEWVSKLKDDQRYAKADIAVLVTSALPEGIKNFGPKEGVYITNFDSFLSVTKLLRLKIIEVNLAKSSTVGLNEKKEIIYNYLRGNEFKQRVEAIIEAFSALRTGLEKEKQLYTKIWASREKQIQRVVDNTIGMHGDLAGLMGESLPEIKQLDETFLLSDSSDVET